jgi:tetratricopeptide (TPR) repeat protein
VPPDLDGALTWYERAATAGHTDAMVKLGALLARQDPPDLDGAHTWYERAATAGHTDAMVNLGALLEGQDPPDLDGARTWYERAATADDTAALIDVAYVSARMGDTERARAAWQAVIDSGSRDVSDAALASAALALAALEALAGNNVQSMAFLHAAGQHGATSAAAYGSALNANPGIRTAALLDLRALRGDSDALNFLGIASYAAGEVSASRGYWVRSVQLDDQVAPLLLFLTDDSSPRG